MKVCVFGAGAVGGYLAARLLKASAHEVSVVARGEQLRALRAQGLRLLASGEDFCVRPHALTDTPRDLPPQDVVLVTLKAHSQPAAAGDIAALLGEQGTAVFANNGIAWWWNYWGPARPGTSLPLLDPHASLWREVRAERALGCVVYSANEVVQPGVVRHAANNHWLLGEPDGRRSERLQAVSALLRQAGLNAEPVDDIRQRIWTKLLRNAPLNSLSALTRLPVNAFPAEPGLVGLCNAVVDEVAAIAATQGVDLSSQLEVAKAAPSLGGALDGSTPASIRPSMLQDVLQGRRMELEAILGQLQAFARVSGTPSPVLDVLVPLLRGLDLGLRQGPA